MLVVSLATGAVITSYYWMHSNLEDIVYVPLYIMILSFVYILAQILKRSILKKQYWWDWLYYIGLIAMVVPTFLGKESTATWWHLITDIGTLFLIVPVVLDGRKLINTK